MTCPLPITDHPKILMAHGGGGKLSQQLFNKIFYPAFENPFLKAPHDSAVLQFDQKTLAFTTDSYVIHPLFFPGGDIGSLAIHGTVNDLAMAGARPAFISVGFILEEGLDMETLWRVVLSMREAAIQSGVQIVTGDTKVVEKGKGDGVFINTSGIGTLAEGSKVHPHQIIKGDAILISGDIGRHGISIMAAREGLEFETLLESDSAPLNKLVSNLLEAGIPIHCMRDLTRGGLASALVELAEQAGQTFEIKESAIPITESVQGACEILGLDPLYVANEGRFVIFLPEKEAEKALGIMKKHPLGKGCAKIGQVVDSQGREVHIQGKIGVSRILDMFTGEQLPRIC